MKDNIKTKVANATKWSTITEILSKLVVPITNLILARILAPEAFGIIATITVVTSFADMLTDAGFQKYIIQHEFSSKDDLYKNANVAFLTNLTISVLVWIIILIFRDTIATFLGNDGLGIPIVIASIQIPITALTSIQMAIYKRKFDFKTLFYRRIIAVLLPFFVTIPLALLGFNYWSLIIGTLTGVIFNAIILTIKSEWKPSLYFKFELLKEMFSFSIWTLIDSIVIWLCAYVDVFVIGHIFDSYHLGLYNNSINIVNAIMNVITSSVTPVLLSGLSRYQNNHEEYKSLLLTIQRTMSYLIIPMGIGIFLYRDLVTSILLGSKWEEATNIIGISSLIVPFMILLSNCASTCYVSKGKPKLSIISQTIYLFTLFPVGIYVAKRGFWDYVYVRNLLKLELLVVNLILINFVIKIPAYQILKNLTKPLFATGVMALLSVILKSISNSTVWSFFSIFVCMITYFIVLYFIDKKELNKLKRIFLKRGKNSE